jgi:hypothetical protein
MFRNSSSWLLCVLVLATPVAAADVDFNRDVLPILSENCFKCHGPDAKARKAGLRLDTREGAFAARDGEPAIVPKNSAKSELIRRVSSTDAEYMMPPPGSNKKLTQKQIETLKRWVDEGAIWSKHWAYLPLGHPAIPSTGINPAARKSIRNPIDAFIIERLQQEGLRLSPEAPREQWLRRVTLDLTGLPPSLDELDAFLKDHSPNAYENVVDRLLRSPRSGERMAADWLDLARFADTHGYQSDRLRPMWPYRDWVISAFNRNLPFDQFVTWQLAGDLLPNATKEQRLATAFNRLHMQNEEGGIVEEEFRVAYVTDRVTTFGTTFLAQTFECCRCHDHKFDPFTQKDFYSLFAFFQNIDESGQTSYFTNAMPVPTLLLSTPEQDKKLAALKDKIAEKEKEWPKIRDAAKPGFEKWLPNRKIDPKALPGMIGSFSLADTHDGIATNFVDPMKPGKAHESPKNAPYFDLSAGIFDGENGFVFPGIGHFSRSDPFSFGLWLNPPTDHVKRAVLVHHSRAPIDAGSRGYELLIEEGKIAFGLHHMWPGNSLKVRTKDSAKGWTHVVVSYDGSSRASGVAIYLNGKPAELEVVRDKLTKDIKYTSGEPDLTFGYRFRDNGFKDGEACEFVIFNRSVSDVDVMMLRENSPLAARSPEFSRFVNARSELLKHDRAKLFDYFLSVIDPSAAKWRKELRDLRDEQCKFIEPIPEIMVMKEMAHPKPAFILKRGAYDAHGEPVSANTPATLPALNAASPSRLDLARWLIQPDHPLTGRVTVNRLWQMMFGRGIVETSENFGRTGAPPTHPELLDLLARDFVDHGWDVKRSLKQIALSATYRQSATVTPELLAKDPYNHLLARMPARRLTAEMLRDQALFVSGLLVDKIGGPSVYPYQPDGIWDEAMGRPHYPRSKGPDLYRRSLYTVWKRTAPPPAMVTFDAADRSICTARRQSTSTPLQSLALLNDPQIVEAARFLGERILKEGGKSRAEQAAWAFRTVTSRTPSEKELKLLVQLFDEQKELFASDPKAAEKLLSVGDKKSDAKFDKTELAAATTLALAILNHDAAVMRR